MIVECPECKTSHSKTEAELANGAAVVCRRCNKAFRLNGSGGTELASGATSADRSSTSVMDVGSIQKNLQAIRGTPDIGLDFDDAVAKPQAPPKASPAPGAPMMGADLFEGLDLDVKVPAAPPVSDATRVDKAPARPSEPTSPKLSGLELADAPKDATKVTQRPSGPTQLGSSFGNDVQTDMIKPGALKEKLNEMRRPSIESVPAGLSEQRAARTPRSAAPFGPPPFPREAARRLGRELREWVLGLPMPRRAAVIGGSALAIIVALASLIASIGDATSVAYVGDSQVLWSGPQAGEVYRQLATLERGARVEVFAEIAEFSLVRDAMGRAGYLRAQALLDEQPAAAPELPFADCERAPIEASIERCQGRAQEQFDSCREVCAAENDEASCLEHCQERFGDCMRVCESDEDIVRPPPRAAELPAAKAEGNPEEPKKRAPKKPAPPKKKKK